MAAQIEMCSASSSVISSPVRSVTKSITSRDPYL